VDMKIIFKPFNYFFIGCSYLASKKIIVILLFVLFIWLIDVSVGYKEEELKQKEIISDNISKEEVNVYTTDINNFVNTKDSALKEKINCYSEGVTREELPDVIVNSINELDVLFNSNNQYFSFLYKDIQTGFTVSYNENGSIFTASTIKAPAVIYLYEAVSRGEVNLDDKLTYTSNFYNTGSGVLKTKEVNTQYSVKDLMEYTIHDSDNIAYAMLVNRFGRENIYNFWKNLGTTNIFSYNTIWGNTSASDASIYMEELYRFYLENEEYGTILMDLFKNAGWKMITNKDGEFNTANKGGWSGTSFHDVAIVFENNPYILVVMSNTGESNYNSLFTRVNSLVGSIHEEYWKYKESVCDEVKQY